MRPHLRPAQLRPRTALAVSALVLPLAVAACGNVSPTSADSGAPPTVDEACSAMADALCGRLTDCAPFAVQLLYGDAATCRSRAKLGCTKDQEVTDTNRTTTDIAACTSAAGQASCDDLVAGIFPAVCRALPGKRLDGEGCGSSWQCMSTHCEVDPNSNCGTCAVRRPVNENCTSNDGCVEGLICANQKCVTPGLLGASCDDSHPCRGNLYCNDTRKACEMVKPAGTACGEDPDVCDLRHGAGCNIFVAPANRTCEMVSVATGGHACGLMSGALTLCVLGNTCAGATLANPTGFCADVAADGAACNADMHCLPPATCVNGLCRLPSTNSCPR